MSMISAYKRHLPELLQMAASIIMLIVAVGFNLWLYRLEPTATTDPNDNAFQFALVDRTNAIWDYAHTTCSQNPLTYPLCFVGYLIDHWVPNWAQGYNLPFYYSHIPQILIVGSFRLLSPFLTMSLFTYYHWVIYLLLCIFPISVFIALRVISFPWLLAGIGALFASHLSTDGLYGLDPSSFLWRGYGLSSQLFAMPWLPLSVAYIVRYFSELSENTKPFLALSETKALFIHILTGRKTGTPKHIWKAIFFLTLTTAGHLGIGIMAFLSAGVISMSFPILLIAKQQPLSHITNAILRSILHVAVITGATILLLSYWIVPTFLSNNYHNISFWDPIWKFNSYGWKEILKNLFNGALLDFGRFPTLTLLTLVGCFGAVTLRPKHIGLPKEHEERQTYFEPLAFLFVFWVLMYFGRTTWGSLIDIIPGMTEFHISRFIVGVHMVTFFLAPLGIGVVSHLILALVRNLLKRAFRVSLTQTVMSPIFVVIVCIVLAVSAPGIYQQTIRYNNLNDELIIRGNKSAATVQADVDELFKTIHSYPPGRVFAGRGGAWGKDMNIAETPYYMHISTYGVPTVLWLPETWSPTSDVEQYFSEPIPEHYDLFNMRWVVAPPKQDTQPFWKLLKENPQWKFYEVPTSGYFTTGTHAAMVATDKRHYVNLVRLWIQSDYPKQKLFPELTFHKSDLKHSQLPRFEMTDEATYRLLDGQSFSLFGTPPIYMAEQKNATVDGPEEVISDMVYKTSVTVEDGCTNCLAILKQSSHPNWRATIDGKPTKHFTVFPFFAAVLVPPGKHSITFSYEPSTLKMILLVLATIAIIVRGSIPFILKRTKKDKLRK